MHAAAPLAVLAAMLALVVARPGLAAAWTVGGAAIMLACGFVSPADALAATRAGGEALLFLLALLALSALVGASGLFEWAAIRAAQAARGDTRVLYRNLFVLGAMITAAMSLDTTAVMLTPIVLALARRAKLPATPWVLLCAIVANVGSLLLPISNLTNLLYSGTFHLAFAAFALRMAIPQLVALAVSYALLRWHFRGELPAQFERAQLGDPADVIRNRRYFRTAIAVLGAVLAGYFAEPLIGVPPYAIAGGGVVVLAAIGVATGQIGARIVRDVARSVVSVFPFVIGLFVAVRALDNLGAPALVARWLGHAPLAAVTGATAIASNLANNLPAALFARSALVAAHAPPAAALAALIGTDVGSIIMPAGSLATILVLTLARRGGAELPTLRYVAITAWMTPVITAASLLALWLTS